MQSMKAGDPKAPGAPPRSLVTRLRPSRGRVKTIYGTVTLTSLGRVKRIYVTLQAATIGVDILLDVLFA